MRRMTLVLAMAAGAMPAFAPGLPGLGGGSGSGGLGNALPGGIPGLGQRETPEQRRAFCQRVAGAAARCGLTLDMAALSACLVRTLPPQDSMRVAQVAQSTRGGGGVSSLLSECGIGLR